MLRCPGGLQFEIARFQLAALPALLPACSALRASLRAALRAQQRLQLRAEDVTLALAELLGRELQHLSLEVLEVGGECLPLAELRTAQRLELARSPSDEQAIVLAPLLRHNARLQCLRTPGMHVDVRRLRALRPGSVVPWSLLRQTQGQRHWLPDTPAGDAECALVAGLLETRRRAPLGSWRRWLPGALRGAAAEAPKTTLELDVCRLGAVGRRCLDAAAGRCGLKVVRLEGPWGRGPGPGRGEGSFCCLVVLCLALAVPLLRVQEDSFARQTGFPGALMAQHPLKSLTFAQRLGLELLPDGEGAAGPAAPAAELAEGHHQLLEQALAHLRALRAARAAALQIHRADARVLLASDNLEKAKKQVEVLQQRLQNLESELEQAKQVVVDRQRQLQDERQAQRALVETTATAPTPSQIGS